VRAVGGGRASPGLGPPRPPKRKPGRRAHRPHSLAAAAHPLLYTSQGARPVFPVRLWSTNSSPDQPAPLAGASQPPQPAPQRRASQPPQPAPQRNGSLITCHPNTHPVLYMTRARDITLPGRASRGSESKQRPRPPPPQAWAPLSGAPGLARLPSPRHHACPGRTRSSQTARPAPMGCSTRRRRRRRPCRRRRRRRCRRGCAARPRCRGRRPTRPRRRCRCRPCAPQPPEPRAPTRPAGAPERRCCCVPPRVWRLPAERARTDACVAASRLSASKARGGMQATRGCVRPPPARGAHLQRPRAVHDRGTHCLVQLKHAQVVTRQVQL
jgi:hypothetical protein